MKKLIVMIAALLVLFAAANAKAELWQENDPAITYYGPWETFTCAECNGGAVKYSTSMALKAEVAFGGTSIKWFTAKAPVLGKAEVYLDDNYMGTVDLYSPTVQYQVVLQKTGLSAGNHKVAIRPTGQKNPESTGYYIVIDAIEADKPLWTLPRGAETFCITANATGDVAVSGYTYQSLDGYPYGGLTDFFVAKFNQAGEKEWLVQIGTPDYDWPGGVTIWENTIYAIRNVQLLKDFSYIVFVDAYNSATGNLLWSTQVGYIMGTGITVDESGIYESNLDILNKIDFNGNLLWQVEVLTGDAKGVDTDNSNVYVGSGSDDLHLGKYTKNGNNLWTVYWGEVNLWEFGGQIAVDSANNAIYQVGLANYDPWYGTTMPTTVVLKYDPNGNLIWVREGLVGAPEDDDAWSVLAGNNNVYGSTQRGYVFKLDADGALLWQNRVPKNQGIYTTGGVALFGDTVFVTDGTNTLRLFDSATGAKK